MTPNALDKMLQQAQRRAFWDRLLHRLGWGLAAGAAIAILTVLIERGLNLGLPPWLPWATLVVGAMAGSVHAYLTRPDRDLIAIHLDRALRLKDRIGTAAVIQRSKLISSSQGRAGAIDVAAEDSAVGKLAAGLAAMSRVAAGPHVDADFAELVRRDAESLIGRIDVRSATPIRITAIWAIVLPLIALLWLGVAFVPALNWSSDSSRRAALTPQQIAAAQEQAHQLSQSIQQSVAELPREQLMDDDQSRANLDALDRLAQQLNDRAAIPEDLQRAREESAARLNELADAMAERSQRELAAAEELARRFRGMEALQRPDPPMSAEEFTKALRRGDFGHAAQQLEELLASDELTEAQRQAAAEHLRDLGREMQDHARTPPPTLEERREQLAQALRDHGVNDPAIEELLNHPPQDPEQIERELREHQPQIDEQIARDLARDLSEHQQQQQVDQKARDNASDMGESLQKAAEQLQQPPENRQSNPEPAQPQTENQTPPSADQPRTSQPDPSQSQARRDQPHESQQQQPSEDSQQQQASGESQPTRESTGKNREESPKQSPDDGEITRRPSTGEDQQEQPQPLSQQPQPQQQQQQQQDQQQQDQQQQDQQPARQAQEESPPSNDSQQQTRESDPMARRSAREQQDPADQLQQHQGSPDADHSPQQQAPEDQGTEPVPPDTPAEALRRLAERRDNAQQDKQSAERLREMAREFMKNTTPEQRRELAEQFMQDQPPPSDPADPDAGDQQELTDEMRQVAQEMWQQMSPEEQQQWLERMQRRANEQQPGSTGSSSDQLPGQSTEQPPQQEPGHEPGQAQDPAASAAAADRSAAGSARGQQPRRDVDDPQGGPVNLPDQTGEAAQRPPRITGADDVDLRGRETADQLIAQWLSEQASAQPRDGSAAAGAPLPRIRHAQDVAQRAVNEAAVQKRYHRTIKRYFDRLNQTVEKAATDGSATTEERR